MKTKELKDSLRELLAWWSSEPQQFRNLVISILAALPGGESLEDDVVCDPAVPMGWKEADMLAKLLSAIRSEEDVRYVAGKLKKPD